MFLKIRSTCSYCWFWPSRPWTTHPRVPCPRFPTSRLWMSGSWVSNYTSQSSLPKVPYIKALDVWFLGECWQHFLCRACGLNRHQNWSCLRKGPNHNGIRLKKQKCLRDTAAKFSCSQQKLNFGMLSETIFSRKNPVIEGTDQAH